MEQWLGASKQMAARIDLMSDPIDYLYPQHVPRPVFAISGELVTGGFKQSPHAHRKAQLFMALRGLVTCEVTKGLWMVPHHCALWIPGDLEHSIRCVGDVLVYTLFVEPAAATGMPQECCTLAVTPLLRELIIAASRLSTLYDCEGPDGRLAQTLLDQLVIAPRERLHLPMPEDARLHTIAEALASRPADRATIAEWAKRVAMSERSLFRLIQQEVGMSFGRWRQQFHIMVALERLACGDSVQAVAFHLGYQNSSAFITMFKKVMGQSPGQYQPAWSEG